MQSVSFFRIRRALLAMLLACALSFVALAARAPRIAYADGPVYGLWMDSEDGSDVGKLVACDATGEETPGGVAPTWDEVTDLFVGRKTVPSYCFMRQYEGTEGVDYVEAPNIVSVTCLDSCTTLEEGAFVYTSESDFHSLDKLESLTLSANTVNVDNYTFASTPEQTKVAVAQDNPHFAMDGDALYRIISDDDLANYPLGFVNSGETELVRWRTATGELTPEDFRSDMTVIAPNAMIGAQVISITLPDTVTCIGSYAFSDCPDLTYLYIPAKAEYLAYDNLERGDSYWTSGTITDGSLRVRYDVAENNASFKDIDGALYSKPGDWLFNWQSAEGTVTVPEETRGIGVCAFRGSAVTEVTLPEGVVSVCNLAFDSCSQLKTINIENPSGLSRTHLTYQSFGDGQSITINVPACAYDVSVDRILYNNESTENLKIVAQHVYGRLTDFTYAGMGEYAYTIVACDELGNVLGTVESFDPEAVTDLFIGVDIPAFAFAQDYWGNRSTLSHVGTIILTDGCTSVGEDLFGRDMDGYNRVPRLSKIRFESNPQLATRVFVDSQPISFEVGEGCTAYAAQDGALYSADMTELISWTAAEGTVEIPDTVKEIWPFAMSGSEAWGISVPEGVKTIGRSAFGDCYGLAWLELPASATEFPFDSGASADNPYLYVGDIVGESDKVRVTVASDNPFIMSDADGALYSKDGTHLLHWPAWTSRIEVPEGVTHIEVGALSGAYVEGSVEEIIFPSTLRAIGQTGVADLSGATLTFKAAEPPELAIVAIDVTGAREIHVPEGAADAYREALQQLVGESAKLPEIIDDVAAEEPEPDPVPTPDPDPAPEPEPPVTVPETEGGTVEVEPVPAGETATVVTEPDAGQEVRDVVVTDADGNKVEVTVDDEGNVAFEMPEGGVTVEVVFGCDGGELCGTHAFADVDQSQWYHDPVDWAVEQEVFHGYDDGGFGPDDVLTREQAAAVLYNYLGGTEGSSDSGLTDVADDWYTDAVNWAVESGVMTGYEGTGTFGVGEALTREQAAVVIMRLAAQLGLDTSARADLSAFPDADGVSSWAADALSWAVASGVINGVELDDGTRALEPSSVCTRAQVAAILMNWTQASE